MATTTSNLSLRKPESTDYVSVSLDIAGNMQTLDDKWASSAAADIGSAAAAGAALTVARSNHVHTVGSGSVSAPGLPVGEANTGLFRPGTGQLAATVAGALAWITTSAGLALETALSLKHISTPSAPAAGYLKLYTKSDNNLYKQTPAGAELGVEIAVGTVVDYAGASAPTGWLLCYGQAINRTTYAALFTVISTTYGVGDGSTTFNIPDLRGRVVAGQDDMGGTSANRLTSPLDGDVLGGAGGSQSHTLTTGEMPAHTHPPTGGYSYVVSNNGGLQITAAGAGSYPGSTLQGDNTSAGGGGAHNNVQPTLILNKIIYAGA